MFERYTDRARRVVTFAQDEARALKHNYIGTEHLLLGLLREPDGIGATVLAGMDVSAEFVRSEILATVGPGKTDPAGQIPYTPRARKVLALALREAARLGHNYIGTEHVLLGLLREGDGVAAQILTRRAISLTEARDAVLAALQDHEVVAAVGGEVGRAAPGRWRGFARKRDQGAGPVCPGCQASLLTNIAYRVVEVSDASGEGAPAKVLFVYCTDCGATIDDLILPDEG